MLSSSSSESSYWSWLFCGDGFCGGNGGGVDTVSILPSSILPSSCGGGRRLVVPLGKMRPRKDEISPGEDMDSFADSAVLRVILLSVVSTVFFVLLLHHSCGS